MTIFHHHDVNIKTSLKNVSCSLVPFYYILFFDIYALKQLEGENINPNILVNNFILLIAFWSLHFIKWGIRPEAKIHKSQVGGYFVNCHHKTCAGYTTHCKIPSGISLVFRNAFTTLTTICLLHMQFPTSLGRDPLR